MTSRLLNVTSSDVFIQDLPCCWFKEPSAPAQMYSRITLFNSGWSDDIITQSSPVRLPLKRRVARTSPPPNMAKWTPTMLLMWVETSGQGAQVTAVLEFSGSSECVRVRVRLTSLIYIMIQMLVWISAAVWLDLLFTGGRDTAGLGGKGGPYRLDSGHTVYQVSQAEKDSVPEEVRRAAREMAEKAFKDRWVLHHQIMLYRDIYIYIYTI